VIQVGLLEKFLIRFRQNEILDIEANIRMARKAGTLGTVFRKFNFPKTRKMSNKEYVEFLRGMIRERRTEIRALEKFKDLV